MLERVLWAYILLPYPPMSYLQLLQEVFSLCSNYAGGVGVFNEKTAVFPGNHREVWKHGSSAMAIVSAQITHNKDSRSFKRPYGCIDEYGWCSKTKLYIPTLMKYLLAVNFTISK